jgi:hypothetical protein
VINSLLGNINPLASLSVTGTTTFGGTNPEVITQGAQTYQGPVRLASDAALSSTGNGDIEFQQTINSTSAPKSLTVNTGGITKFEGNVGTINPLMNITTDAAGTTDLNAPIMHTVGVQTYNDSTVLTVPTEIISGGVAFNSTLLAPFALTINADSGDISFGGSSGATSTLTDLTITNARNVTNNGLLLANSFTQLGGSGTTNFGTNIGSSTIIGGGAGTLYVVTNNAIGNIDVGKLLLGTNFANLTGLVGGSPGITTNIVPLNFILPKTHFFNGIDLFNAIIVPVAVDIAFHSMPYYLIESRALRPLTDQAGICIIWPELGIKDCGGVKWSKEQNK